MTAIFKVGDVVALAADRRRSGPVIEVVDSDTRPRYRVYHDAGTVREYFGDQLVRMEAPAPNAWSEPVSDDEWCEPQMFRARLTALRLANPQSDHLYAFQSARIQFIPFQFKPLLRLLRADRPRLLIADDVGVGKTIEAGLILKELQARQPLERVMVLCPKALTTKWRAEMRRFDEDFRILDSRALRYCLNEAAMEGKWPAEYSRAIVHYELLRMEHYLWGHDHRDRHRPGLLELDPVPAFDAVIADEAHHLRTPGTASHDLMQFLCEISEVVLMLTATPVQTKADNLFSLLNLLRSDLFPDAAVFRLAVEPNRHLTRAITLLRTAEITSPDWLGDARAALDDAARTEWGRTVLASDPQFTDVRQRIQQPALDQHERVRCIRDLEDVHTLSHVMNRTRRRDIGRFTIRDPQTITVPFTPEQQRVYETVLEFRQEVLLLEHDPLVVRLIMDTIERQAASSIHALAGAIDDVLATGGLSLAVLTDDPDADEAIAAVPPVIAERARHVAEAAASLPPDDPKLDALLELVDTALAADGPGKVLVFSFFLRTIEYVRQHLAQRGVRVGVVTGQVADEDRERLRELFRRDRTDPDAIDVLLSSEVGCEGLDYEFCDRLVNYDIPWNPMRIEQRIGRIDRFGQRSEKVLIYNFITPGTVEERVFYRCFDRIGIFRDTVGDLEEVLGELVEDLNRVALDTTLTPEQAEAKARQLADNVIRLADEQRRIDEQSGQMMGLDTAFTTDVENLVDEGRIVSADDVRALVATFASDVGARLDDQDQPVARLRGGTAARSTLADAVRASGTGRPATTFVRDLESDGDGVLLTFDQATAAERRQLPFVTGVHPLARAAVGHLLQQDGRLVARLRADAADLPSGSYVFSCELWETIAAAPDSRLMTFAVDSGTGQPMPEVGGAFLRLLGHAETSTSTVSPLDLDDRLRDLARLSEEEREQAVRDLQQSNDLVLNRRLASLESALGSTIQRLRADLEVLAEERIVRMKRSQLARTEHDLEQRRATLDERRRVDILTTRVAAGVLEVTG